MIDTMLDVYQLTLRSLREVVRQPAFEVQNYFIPLFFFAVTVGALGNVSERAFGLENYRAFAMPVAILQGAAGGASYSALAMVTDIERGYFDKLLLTPTPSISLVLGRLFGDRLRVLDSGCCGMAGSFGYTVDHYELAMRIGELSLFGAIRAEPQATVVAPGTSCRHQILDGTGRRAVHPIESVAAALDLVY